MGVLSSTVKRMVGARDGHIEKQWSYNSQKSLLAPPVAFDINKDGKHEIIIGTKEGELLVLDEHAQLLWNYSINEQVDAVEEMFLDQEVLNSINSQPTIYDLAKTGRSNILFGTELGFLYCLDDSGKLWWKFKTESAIRGSPVVVDIDGNPHIIFGSADKHLYILDPTGKLIQKFEQHEAIESTPGFFDGQIIFGLNDGTIVSLKENGEETWRFKTSSKVTARPAFTKINSQDVVIIGSTDNNLYCLDVDGELIWTYETEGAIYSKATIADLNNDQKMEIVIGSCDNNIHAINSDGEKLWTYETDFWVVGTPLAVDIDGDGKLEVIAGSYDHNIYILDSEGTYILDYVPGLSGVVQQPGHYTSLVTQEPGQTVGKKIWQFKTDGVVVGCAQVTGDKRIVVGTKIGILNGFEHKRG